MANDISPLPQHMALGDMQTLAVAIAKSGLFGIRTPEQALVLMAIAQAEGRHPVEAARDYDIINNRPAKKAEAMLRDFITAGGKVEWHELSDKKADATFTHPQTGSVRIDWDMQRATTAFGKKDMYAKFPRQMLRSRVVSEGVRTLWPLATSGMYEPTEVANIPPVEHTGPTVEAIPEPPPDPVPEPPPAPPEPNYAAIVAQFETAAARIQDSDQARQLLKWKPGVIAITAMPNGTERNRYMQARAEVQTKWLAPAPETKTADTEIEGL